MQPVQPPACRSCELVQDTVGQAAPHNEAGNGNPITSSASRPSSAVDEWQDITLNANHRNIASTRWCWTHSVSYPSSKSLLSAEQPPAEERFHGRVHLGRHGVRHTLLQFHLQAVRPAAPRICTYCCSKWLFQARDLAQGVSTHRSAAVHASSSMIHHACACNVRGETPLCSKPGWGLCVVGRLI